MKEKKLAGNTPFERFQSLAKALVAVPSAEVEKPARRSGKPRIKKPR
jgi:hypothetical protein